jgi:hypothetical protein
MLMPHASGVFYVYGAAVVCACIHVCKLMENLSITIIKS